MRRIFFVPEIETQAPSPRLDHLTVLDGRTAVSELTSAARALEPYGSVLAQAQHWCGASEMAQDCAFYLRHLLDLEEMPIHVRTCFGFRPADAEWDDWHEPGGASEVGLMTQAHLSSTPRSNALAAWIDETDADAFIVGDLLAARFLMRRIAQWTLPAIFRLHLSPATPIIISERGAALLNSSLVQR